MLFNQGGYSADKSALLLFLDGKKKIRFYSRFFLVCITCTVHAYLCKAEVDI